MSKEMERIEAVLDEKVRPALRAHGGAHVQLAVRPQGQIHLGISHIAPHIPRRVGHRQNGAQRAGALNLQGQAGALPLEGVAHHGAAGQGTSQGRRGHRQGLMDLSGALGEAAAADGCRLHHAIGGDGSDDSIAHNLKIPSLLCGLENGASGTPPPTDAKQYVRP